MVDGTAGLPAAPLPADNDGAGPLCKGLAAAYALAPASVVEPARPPAYGSQRIAVVSETIL